MTLPTTDSPDVPGSTSSAWLDRLKARDSDAWAKLVQLYGPLVYSWCRRCGLPAQETPDVTQDVFQAVAANVSRFQRQGPGSFRRWLKTVTQNKVNDHFRRRAGPAGAGGSDAQERLAAVPEGVSSESDQADGPLFLKAVLERIRPQFEEHTWQAFWRLTVEGHSSADIAAELGMTPEAVRQSKARVLRRLRSEMEATD